MVGPGEPGQSTGIWVISIFGGAPQKLHDEAEGAVLSPDGSKVAFLHEEGGDWEVWVMAADGSSPHRVLAGEKRRIFDALQWSPDNTYIAYLTQVPKPDGFITEVQALRPDAGPPVTILSDPKLQSYTWLSDNRLIFALSEPAPNEQDANLWQVSLNPQTAKPVGEKRRITDWAGFQFYVLSATNDAKRLAFLKARFQVNIFAGDLGNPAARVTLRQLTSGERSDYAQSWSPDGKSIFFLSDRNGKADIFKQDLSGGQSQEFLLGPDEHAGGEITPDRQSLLYFSWPKMPEGHHPTTRALQRVPVGGGVSQTVLTAAWDSNARCSENAPGRCVLSEQDADAKQLVFTEFDPAQGRKGEIARVDLAPSAQPDWDISPDGTAIAVAGFSNAKNTIRVISLAGAVARDITVQGPVRMFHVAWSHDKGFLVTGSSKRRSVLLHVDENGKAEELWNDENAIGLGQPLPSPDGKHIVFGIARLNSNIWMLENF